MNPFALSSCHAVVSYKLDRKIRYKLEAVENAFKSLLGADAKNLNVPDDADPNVARFILQKSTKKIAVTQVTTQFELDFEKSDKPEVDIREIIKKNVFSFWDHFLKFKTAAEVSTIAVVFVYRQKSTEGMSKVASELVDGYASLPDLGEPASFSLTAGFLHQSHDYYVNLTASTYEVRQTKFLSPVEGSTFLDFDEMEVVETGKEIKVDINTKPMQKKGISLDVNSFSVMFEKFDEVLDVKIKHLIGDVNVQ